MQLKSYPKSDIVQKQKVLEQWPNGSKYELLIVRNADLTLVMTQFLLLIKF